MNHKTTYCIIIFAYFSILSCLSTHSHAQQNNTITGILIDSLTQTTLSATNITLYSMHATDSMPLHSTISDRSGYFSIPNVQSGIYRISLTRMGYHTRQIPHIKLSHQSIDLGTIQMAVAHHQLQQVDINIKAPLIQIKADRLIYNTSLDPTLAGGNAADAIRKIPMLSVDIAGQVALRGDKNVTILLDGKPSGSLRHHTADALKMIPADQIKSIEVLTSPSSKYDAEGSSGIIIIHTKRGGISGVHGSYSAEVGSRQNNLNANISIQKGKLGINSNIGNSWSWPVDTRITFEQKLRNNNPHIDQQIDSRNKRNGERGSLSVDYSLDSNHLFLSNFHLNQLAVHTDNILKSRYIDQSPVNSNNHNQLRFGGFDWSADYIRKFQKKNQELSLSVQLSKNKTHTNYQSRYPSIAVRPNETGQNLGHNREITIQLDYTHPLKKSVLELGAKAIYRNIHSTVEVDTMGPDDSYIRHNQRTYRFDYKQDVSALYGTIQIPINTSFELKGGLRYEYTGAHSQSSDDQANSHKPDHHLLPSIVAAYQATDKLYVKLSYNQRIQRPSLYFINPFRNESDPINQMQGNPALQPELTHHIEIGTHHTLNKATLNLSLYHRNTNQVIEPIYNNITQRDKPIVLQTFANIGRIRSFGSHIFASVDLFNILTLRGNIDIYIYRILPQEPYRDMTDQADQIFINYKTFISATLNLKNGFSAETFFFFDAPERTYQGYYAAFNMWNISIKKHVFNKKGTLGLTIVDPFQDIKNLGSHAKTNLYEQKGNFAVPFRSFGLMFSWKFGTNNPTKNTRASTINNNDQKTGGEQNR